MLGLKILLKIRPLNFKIPSCLCCFVWNARTLSTYWTKPSRDWNLHNGWHGSLRSCPWLRLIQPLPGAVIGCCRSACQGWVQRVETCFQGVTIKRQFAGGRNTAFLSLVPKSVPREQKVTAGTKPNSFEINFSAKSAEKCYLNLN